MIAGSATRAGLERAADRVLVRDDSGAHTGADIDAAVDRFAALLVRQVSPGGSVALWAWNSAALLVAHMAIERAGLTRVPIDPEAPAREAEAIMGEAGVSAVVLDSDHSADWPVETIELSDDLWSHPSSEGFEDVEVEESATAIRIVRGIVNGKLLAIPLSFANWEAHMTLAAELFDSGAYGDPQDDRSCFLTVQQMQYGTGLLGTFPFVRLGYPQVILRKFDAERVAEAVAADGPMVTFMVPGMITRLADHLRGRRPNAWDLQIIYGGAPFPLDDMLSSMDTLGSSLTQVYGRFEGGWPLTILTSEDHARIANGEHGLAKSCGRRVPGVELELRPLAGGDSTELRVRSDCVSAPFADPDGWCALGDVATQDEQGYFYLAGRVDGMINTGSFHVYPDEVEAAIREEFEELIAVKVSARADERWGEAVCAAMTWESAADVPDAKDFRSRMLVRLAKYKVPTIVEHEIQGRAGEGASV